MMLRPRHLLTAIDLLKSTAQAGLKYLGLLPHGKETTRRLQPHAEQASVYTPTAAGKCQGMGKESSLNPE